MAAVFLGCYVARIWQFWDTTSALHRYQLFVVTDATSGRRYCAEEVLLDLPREAAPPAR